MIAADRYPWMAEAACRGCDPDLFHPARGERCDTAITICRNCPVRLDCLEHAMTFGEEQGIWGGLSAKARRKLRSQRNRTRRHLTIVDGAA